MPALVNYSGDDELYPGGSFCPSPMELGRLYSTIGSNLDLYYPPNKRSRSILEAIEGEQHYQEPGIEVLPDECLFEIFRRLPSGKERSLCACVSKRWLMLMSSICKDEIERTTSVAETVSPDENQDIECDGYLTRCLDGKKATDVRLAAIAVGTSSRGGLGKLSIRGSNSVRGVTNLGLSAVAHGCPSLRSLSLWNVSSIGDEGLSHIAKGCHILEKLDLSHCSSITNKGLIAIAEGCPNMTTLNMESCPNIGNEGLQALARLCPKLQSISIKDCPLVGDHGVSNLLSLASNLSRVKLQNLNITDFSLAVICHYGRAITNLGVTDKSIEAIGKGCINLKQMYLRRCCFVTDSGLVAFAKAAVSLESLQLEECNRFTQSGIIVALSNIKTKLRSLTLVKCTGVKDIDMEVSMLSPCQSLRSLAIQKCPGFGSSSLAMIGKLCPQLRHLNLTGLYGITDAGLLPLLENCEAGLVNVNLAGCWNLTDNIVSALARLHGGTLEVLNLDGCMKITDASLVIIANNCLVLNDLDVSKCAITDAGIAVLSRASLLSLQVLSLSGCSDVSNKCVPFLTILGQTLIGLNIQNCNSISSSTIELLVEKLWRCDILV
ncbi:hypothetical protein ACSQ67_006859 [Phaseolus vulgaris]